MMRMQTHCGLTQSLPLLLLFESSDCPWHLALPPEQRQLWVASHVTDLPLQLQECLPSKALFKAFLASFKPLSIC